MNQVILYALTLLASACGSAANSGSSSGSAAGTVAAVSAPITTSSPSSSTSISSSSDSNSNNSSSASSSGTATSSASSTTTVGAGSTTASAGGSTSSSGGSVSVTTSSSSASVGASNGSGSTSSGGSTASATPSPSAQTGYHSCKEILAAHPGSASGNYTIYLGNTQTQTQVICDMTYNGGGWTVILDADTATRAAVEQYFDHASTQDIPDANVIHDSVKGLFWLENQYISAKNIPANTEFASTYSLNSADATYGNNCYAILGFLSPTGYMPLVNGSFSIFVQKNDTSAYIKSQYNLDSGAQANVNVTNQTTSYPYAFRNGSRVISGNPYGSGHTCKSFFLKRIMVR